MVTLQQKSSLIIAFIHSLQQNYDAQAGSLVYFAADQSSSSLIHSLQQQQQQNDQAQGSLVLSFETGREIHNLFSTSFHMQQGLKQQQQQQLGLAVILLQLLLFFSFEPWHVLQSLQFVVTFSSNQIVYRSRRRRRRRRREPSTTMQQKTYPTYHEAPAPAPAFAKRRSCSVPSKTP